jgi:hypothetical protein
MGSVERRLRERAEAKGAAPQPATSERLRAAAIMRDGTILERGFKSHWELRAALNPERDNHTETVPGDIDGFVTTTGRFVDRAEAQEVAFAAGQISALMRRPLLSSDINW